MAISIVETLDRFGFIEQDFLAQAFADRYAADPMRGYGGGAHDILSRIVEGNHWEIAARSAFGGQGSYGNGGGMRAAPIGAYFKGMPERAASEADLSATVTHAHPEGRAGAIAVATLAALAGPVRQDVTSTLSAVARLTPAGRTRAGIEQASLISRDANPRNVGLRLGNGSRVSAEDTIPFALWCAASFGMSYEDALWATVSALGDRDTTCAIVGGVAILTADPKSVPATWVSRREPLPQNLRQRAGQ